jgi:hypothetical protein
MGTYSTDNKGLLNLKKNKFGTVIVDRSRWKSEKHFNALSPFIFYNWFCNQT